MGAGGSSYTTVPSAISGGGGAEGEGITEAPGGAGGRSEACGAGFAAAPGGAKGGVGGCAEAVPMVHAPSTQTHPELPCTQWPPTQSALGEGGISQRPATQTQRCETLFQCPAIQT